MAQQSLEVADIFRACGPAWRQTRAGHLSHGQLKVMSAIERCRSAALRWLTARQSDLLPVDYYHVVFTLPAPISDIAYQNKLVIYGILFKAAAETLLTIARDPKHLGARIGVTMVLHTRGSALTHHPHVHCIVPGGGFSVNNQQWQACKPGFFLPVRILSRLFRRLFLNKLKAAHQAGELHFFGEHQGLADAQVFTNWCRPFKQQEWVVYAKRPFAGPKAVLAYLSRYTHRVAIANSRLITHDAQGVTFKWKDYREKGRTRHKTMTLAADELIRRFLIHVLPHGFHRIRHYGLFANSSRADNLIQARKLLNCETSEAPAEAVDPGVPSDGRTYVCPACGVPMIVIEIFARGQLPRAPPPRIAACV